MQIAKIIMQIKIDGVVKQYGVEMVAVKHNKQSSCQK